ncbi:MAG: hypothetical protein CL902_00975 [Dehalococcoidia bacterium]|nr:hypothetical protein [Dehalococcoidia bacterium]|tara:strand:+ start:163 stop:645 length:483 start_codon:yes stop_codon:yes gene_type:complete
MPIISIPLLYHPHEDGGTTDLWNVLLGGVSEVLPSVDPEAPTIETMLREMEADLHALLRNTLLEEFLIEFQHEMTEQDETEETSNVPEEMLDSTLNAMVTHEEAKCDCCICRDFVIERKTVCLPCNHTFHYDCIKDWLRRKDQCPMCREHVVVRDSSTSV